MLCHKVTANTRFGVLGVGVAAVLCATLAPAGANAPRPFSPVRAGERAAVKGEDASALQAVKERAARIKTEIETELPSLEKLYQHLHSHPELSYQEEQTSAR